MTLISTVTVGSGGSNNLTFSSIPATFTDLYVNFSLRSAFSVSGQTGSVIFRFNGDTASNYSERRLEGTGSSTLSSSASGGEIAYNGVPNNNATANTFGNGNLYIPNYASATAKSLSFDSVTETNATTTVGLFLVAGRWNNTAAITSLAIINGNGTTFMENSTASLYGILKGSGGATVS
jgi:hypothetical protein